VAENDFIMLNKIITNQNWAFYTNINEESVKFWSILSTVRNRAAACQKLKLMTEQEKGAPNLRREFFKTSAVCVV